MSDHEHVRVVKDNLEPRQWGKNPFLFSDGKKRSVDRRKLKYALIATAVVIAVVQCLFGGDTPNLVKPAPIALDAGAQSKAVAVAAIQPEPVSSPKVSAKGAHTVVFSGPQVISRPRNLKAIPAGTMADAVLLTGASNGVVRAQLTTAVSVGASKEIEAGTTLFGTGSSSEERLYVHFVKAVFADGTTGDISAQAYDAEDRIVGLKGSTIGTAALNISGSVGLGFVGGLAEGLQETRGDHGAVVRPPTLENALLNALSRTALEQSQNLMTDLKSRKPIIEVPSGKTICVIWGDR